MNQDKGTCLLKIHDNALLSQVSNEYEHNSLYISKDKTVNKIHAQCSKRNAREVKAQSSNLSNKARIQRNDFNVVLVFNFTSYQVTFFLVFVAAKIGFFSREET